MDHTISVIIPCYNQGHFLPDAIDSVMKQTYSNWECIIVDDGSSDNTSEISQNLTQKDNRFKYVYKTNGGLSSARNKGLEHANGNWIQFLDADDVLEPAKFYTQLQSVTVNKQKTGIVIYSDYAFGKPADISENEARALPVQFISQNFFEELISRWETALVIPCHCFLFSSNFFFKDRIRFDETLPNHEDFDCWLAVFSTRPRVIFNETILCRYRLSDQSMSTNMRLMGEGFLQVLHKHLQVKAYSVGTRLLLQKKRLEVLQVYRRFNLMTIKEKFASRKVLQTYYKQRILDKLTLK